VKLFDLAPTACRWPYGDGPFTFCGHRHVQGQPYCAYHVSKAFNPRVRA
jgi:hypothetical protein